MRWTPVTAHINATLKGWRNNAMLRVLRMGYALDESCHCRLLSVNRVEYTVHCGGGIVKCDRVVEFLPGEQ